MSELAWPLWEVKSDSSSPLVRVEQRLVSLGRLARTVYETMVRDPEFEFKASFLEHLLALSKYQRQRDLPFAEILATTVFGGRRPHPQVVAQVVENLFPFTNMNDTRTILEVLVKLQSDETNDDQKYTIDVAVLESIAAAVAREGDVEAIRLVWEYLDESDMDPSIGIYECTAVTFCHDPEKYRNAFAVLEEM